MGESNPKWRPTSQYLEYEFFRSFPIAINSMPVSYEAANLLKCTVSMNYIRYTVQRVKDQYNAPPAASPVERISYEGYSDQSAFNLYNQINSAENAPDLFNPTLQTSNINFFA